MELAREIEELMTVAVAEATRLQSKAIEPIHLLVAVCYLSPTIVFESFEAHGISTSSLALRLRMVVAEKCERHEAEPQRISGRVMRLLDKARVVSDAYGYPLGLACLLIAILENPDEMLQQAFVSEAIPAPQVIFELNNRLADEKAREAEAIHDNERRASERRASERRATDAPSTKEFVLISRYEHPYTPTLDLCGRDYTAMARAGKIDPVIGRLAEIKRVIRVLLQKQKNNPALVGDAGVGKTSIVEGLARFVVDANAPEEIRDWRIVELLLTALVAGTTFRGELEEKLRRVMEEVESDPKLILFIDELHTLMGAGSAIGALDVAGILKPALARGQLRVIGATTTMEYRRYIEKDPALERRFQPVRVKEPTAVEAREIMAGLRPVYESHHGVKITEEALDAAIELSIEYLPDRRLPDKARDLIDQAAVKKRFISLTPGHGALGTPEVKREDIAETVAEWVGIPVERLFFKPAAQQPAQIEEVLHRRVIGQKEAVSQVARAVRTALAGLSQPDKPSGVFLFMGPTGVGKTELARALAEFLFGDQRRLIRFDMSEYMEEHSVAKLIGSPPGYIGHDDGGLLINTVRSNPYCVLLFDEIEKAHPRIADLFLQIFDAGRLTDSSGRTADFRNALIILTTNIRMDANKDDNKTRYGFRAGSKNAGDNDEEEIEAKHPTQVALRKLLLNHFRPELVNRIGKIAHFRSLRRSDIRAIIDKMLDGVRLRLEDKNLGLEFVPDAYDALAEVGYKPEWGARELERIIEQQVVEPLAHGLLSGRYKPGETIHVIPNPKGGGVSLTNIDPMSEAAQSA